MRPKRTLWAGRLVSGSGPWSPASGSGATGASAAGSSLFFAMGILLSGCGIASDQAEAEHAVAGRRVDLAGRPRLGVGPRHALDDHPVPAGPRGTGDVDPEGAADVD